jgi:hypothetical protein
LHFKLPFTAKVISRRDLLKVTPIAIVAGVAFTTLAAKPFWSKFTKLRGDSKFPEGSIYTPADKHTKI